MSPTSKAGDAFRNSTQNTTTTTATNIDDDDINDNRFVRIAHPKLLQGLQ